MTVDRRHRAIAKKLVDLSKDDDGLLSEDRVREVLKGLTDSRRAGLRGILKAYLFFVKREIRESSIRVEHAGELAPDVLESIREALSREYGRKLRVTEQANPELIAGVRIQVGDDVINNSVAGRLAALESTID